MQSTVVIATWNRSAVVARAVERLLALPERPSVVVVDNGSSDDTVSAVRAYPAVELVVLEQNAGAAARTIGARVARTRYVSISDDDCWWRAGALVRACSILERHPNVGLVNACVRVGDDGHVDEACELMARSQVARAAVRRVGRSVRSWPERAFSGATFFCKRAGTSAGS